VAVDVNPLTGDPLPATSQIRLNSYRFFQGVDPRLLYFLTIVNPYLQKRELGVTDFSQLTTAMATCGGCVVSIGGAAPTPGDLQELMYVLRVDAPPVSTKVIDGSFADWQQLAVKVAGSGAAYIGQPAPDLGSIWVAVDASYLYVQFDRDLTPFLTGVSDGFEIEMESQTGLSGLRWSPGTGYQTWNQSGPLPEFVGNAQGLELRLPTGAAAGSWVTLRFHTDADNASYRFSSSKEHIYVKVQ
jgi:hypothetical protein